jgi:hypothetical protein
LLLAGLTIIALFGLLPRAGAPAEVPLTAALAGTADGASRGLAAKGGPPAPDSGNSASALTASLFNIMFGHDAPSLRGYRYAPPAAGALNAAAGAGGGGSLALARMVAKRAAGSLLPFAGVAKRSSYATVEALVAAQPEVINICHPDWHGIRAATYAQGEAVLEVPGIKDAEHAAWLLDFLAGLRRLRSVVVNGIPPNMVEFAGQLKATLPHVTVLFVYHGAPSNQFHEDESGLVSTMIGACATGCAPCHVASTCKRGAQMDWAGT